MKKPDYTVPVHVATKFTWVGDNGSAEASDFKNDRVSGRVWNDSYDLGFNVVNPRTGRVKLFTWESDGLDSEGELTYFVYVSECRKHRITIFND